MDLSRLRPDTGRLWKDLAANPLLRGFVLIGGTALAMRLQHRVSEDLDFAYPHASRFPRDAIAKLIAAQGRLGNTFVETINVRAHEESIDAGNDLRNYQQDYLVNGITKVTFFSPDNEVAQLIKKSGPASVVRVATMHEIFETKCHVVTERQATRDWFDLYVLMSEHGVGVEDAHRMFAEIGVPQKYEIFKSNLLRMRPWPEDPGYIHLTDQAPSLDTMRTFFAKQFQDAEADMAEAARLRHLAQKKPD